MTIALTEEQRRAIAAGEPPRLVDHETNETYVLVPAGIYDRFREMMEEAADETLRRAWLEMATQTRRAWVKENPY